MAQSSGLGIRRHFTKKNEDAYTMFRWTKFSSETKTLAPKSPSLKPKPVEFPDTWSIEAIKFVSEQYFKKIKNTTERETSLRQVVDRVVDTITRHGERDGYFIEQNEAKIFSQELKYILVSQRATFDALVWQQLGVGSSSVINNDMAFGSDKVVLELREFWRQNITKGDSSQQQKVVKISNDFIRAVENDGVWQFDDIDQEGSPETVKAREIWHLLAQSAWQSSNLSLLFQTTASHWQNTLPAKKASSSSREEKPMFTGSGRMLSSINLVKFLDDNINFDVSAYKQTIQIMAIAQEILISYFKSSSSENSQSSWEYREIALGYVNLGSMLMAQALPYDSESGRAQAAAVTAILTGHSYATSARLASKLGPFASFSKNRENIARVFSQHRDAVRDIDPRLVAEDLLQTAAEVWDEAIELGARYGVRNSSVSALEQSPSISQTLDCSTDGFSPETSLVKQKKSVNGSSEVIVSTSVGMALEALDYTESQIEDITKYISENDSVIKAPHMEKDNYNIFSTQSGENFVSFRAHIQMIGALQPFVSTAINKPVLIPADTTTEDIQRLWFEGWRLGLRAFSIYRDKPAKAEPINISTGGGMKFKVPELPKQSKAKSLSPSNVTQHSIRQPRPVPRIRNAKIFEFYLAKNKGFVTVGEYEDGSPCEIFIQLAKQDSTVSGLVDALAISISHGLQHGVPLKSYIKAMVGMSFAPSGATNDEEITTASSLVDYIFRRLAKEYLSLDDQLELNLTSLEELDAEADSNQSSLLS